MTRGRLLKMALLYLYAHLLGSPTSAPTAAPCPPEAPDIISRCFTLTFLLRAPLNSHPSLCHLLTARPVAAAANTRQTFPYLKRRFISVTNRLMGFKNKQGRTRGVITQRNKCESLGLFSVRSFYRKASARTSSFRI